MHDVGIDNAVALKPTVRLATENDAPAIAALVNTACRDEGSPGDRDHTDADRVRALQREGVFLVLERQTGALAASIHVCARRGRGSFALLAVAPELESAGIDRRLIGIAEALCEAEGCTEMELAVDNLRAELPPWYRSMGYQDRGPIEPAHTAQGHSIRMTKPLA